MDVSISGTVYNLSTWAASPFSVSFSFSGGDTVTAGCDSALINAQVTGFSAEIGGSPLASPASFTANLTTTPYPCGGQVYGNFVGGPLLLESKGALFTLGSTFTGGALGTYDIGSAAFTVATPDPPAAGVPEPGTAGLMLVALVAYRVQHYARHHQRQGN